MEYEVKLENFGVKAETMTIFDEDFHKSSDFCQACLSTRKNVTLKDISQKYYYSGKYEVYSEMLQFCFSIKLGYDNKDKLSNTSHICDTCVKKLRDAANFKSQVENAQKKIKQRLEMPVLLPKSKVNLDVDSDDEMIDAAKDIPSVDNSYDTDSSSSSDDYFMDNNTPPKSEDIPKSKESNKTETTKGKKSKSNSKAKKKSTASVQRLGFSDLPYRLDFDQLQCMECNEIFETHRRLQLHMPNHFPNFTCEFCGRVFASAQQWNVHKKTHSTATFECKLCPGKQFKTRASLLLHMKTKHGDEKFKVHRCPQCTERFMSYDQRQKHLSEVHGEELPVFKCNLCESTFRSSALRSSHVRNVHLNERNHICQICNGSFFSKGMLTKHMLKHTGIKNFTCEVCSKSFQRKHTLSEHMKIHTGEKNHVCHICNRAFTQKCSLKGHLASHERDNLKES